jgi:hypothetical protein
MKRFVIFAAATIAALSIACSGNKPAPGAPNSPSQSSRPDAAPPAPTPLPNTAFKAELSIIDPPKQLHAGEKTKVRVKIKNASNDVWWERGAPTNTRPDNKYYVAAGDRWLKADGSLLTEMDGRIGIGKDLKPGEETEVSLLIQAPKDPGDYTLDIDLVQEQVTWFHDKGSPTAKAKITVVK